MQRDLKKIIVTGAAGFIGSAFVREALKHGVLVHVVDCLTYAGHIENLETRPGTLMQGVTLSKIDISSWEQVSGLRESLGEHDAIVHFAAESHVDNSISGPQVFVNTNIVGTFNLLELTRQHKTAGGKLRMLHVSTDEVFGELGDTGKFSEASPYMPNSPYSASKAASDHLVRAWHHTYDLDTVITNCSNNYGPRQFPEKLIPRMIVNALEGKKLPVYGKGLNVRDWIHVEDHARGIWHALVKAAPGSTYCFGGNAERTNIEVVESICRELDKVRPLADGRKYREQIEFVEDRAGHDLRYAIDDSKAARELGYQRIYESFEDGLKNCVLWYLENQMWIDKTSVSAKARKST